MNRHVVRAVELLVKINRFVNLAFFILGRAAPECERPVATMQREKERNILRHNGLRRFAGERMAFPSPGLSPWLPSSTLGALDTAGSLCLRSVVCRLPPAGG